MHCNVYQPIEQTLCVNPHRIRCKGCFEREFDHENIAFAAHSLLCTMQTKGTVRCMILVRHLAGGLGLAVARTVRPSVAPERVLIFALSTVWRALSVTNP